MKKKYKLLIVAIIILLLITSVCTHIFLNISDNNQMQTFDDNKQNATIEESKIITEDNYMEEDNANIIKDNSISNEQKDIEKKDNKKDNQISNNIKENNNSNNTNNSVNKNNNIQVNDKTNESIKEDNDNIIQNENQEEKQEQQVENKEQEKVESNNNIDEEYELLKSQVEYNTYQECMDAGFKIALSDTVNILGFDPIEIIYKGKVIGYKLKIHYTNPMED